MAIRTTCYISHRTAIYLSPILRRTWESAKRQNGVSPKSQLAPSQTVRASVFFRIGCRIIFLIGNRSACVATLRRTILPNTNIRGNHQQRDSCIVRFCGEANSKVAISSFRLFSCSITNKLTLSCVVSACGFYPFGKFRVSRNCA